MRKKPVPKILEPERKKTDDSLLAERDKANTSLTEARLKTEIRIDQTVEDERNATDLSTEKLRTKSDASRKSEYEDPNYSETDDRIKSDTRLFNERKDADRAIEKERSNVDQAMVRERNLKENLINSLLSQERELTDDNLSAERSKTDHIANESSNLLSTEISDHKKTKFSLTTRDEFLAMVSHDLRSPISTAASCADMLLSDSSYNLTPEVRPWIELMKRNVDAALRLIADILDMERVAEGKLMLSFKPYNIEKILHDSVEGFVLSASAKDVLLRFESTKITEDTICDHDRILQILSNLIGNALKFTPRGGTITLKATMKDSHVEVCVHDTGPGIPEDKVKAIFDRFTQLGKIDNRGLGLGLYISKMLVDAHGGRLWVHSKEGEGSTFTFSLPRLPSNLNNRAH